MNRRGAQLYVFSIQAAKGSNFLHSAAAQQRALSCLRRNFWNIFDAYDLTLLAAAVQSPRRWKKT